MTLDSLTPAKIQTGIVDTIKRTRYYARIYLAEFFGTYVFIVCALGGVAAFGLTGGLTSSAFADWLTLSLSFGLGLTFAIYLAVGVSGGHLNPAVTVMFALYEAFPWRRVPGYILAQMVGAFAAAATVYGLYYGAIMKASQTAGYFATSLVFYTMPQPYESYVAGIFDQFFMSALFGVLIYPILDAVNAHPEANLGPLFVGLALTLIAISFGSNTGFAVNPARDFGPRVFASMVYGRRVFTDNGGYFWIPLVIPFIGLPFGGGLYKLLIVRPKKFITIQNLNAETNAAPKLDLPYEDVVAQESIDLLAYDERKRQEELASKPSRRASAQVDA